jgi:hypothetical protein
MGQGGLEPFLRQADAGLDAPLRIRWQAVPEIGSRAGGVTPQVGSHAGNHQRGPPVDQEALAAEINARAQQFLPGQFGVAAMRFLHARYHAGHGDRTGTVKVAVVLYPRPREDVGRRAVARQRIVLRADAAGCAHTVVDHLIAVFPGAVEHHRSAAADAAHPRFQHPQREGGGDDRVHAVPASPQHLGTYFGGFSRLRGDDAAFGDHRRFADLLGVAELVVHGVAFAVVHIC